MNTIRESALKVDWEMNPLPQRDTFFWRYTPVFQVLNCIYVTILNLPATWAATFYFSMVDLVCSM